MTLLFGKKRAAQSCAVKKSQWKARTLRLESLESRELLAADPTLAAPIITEANNEIVVNSLADNTTVDEYTTLREAIAQALAADVPQTITFADSLKTTDRTITLSSGQFELSKTLTIDATSVGGITIDAQKQSRIFCVSGGTSEKPVVLKGLTLQNGYSTGCGGAIDVIKSGFLWSSHCNFVSNWAELRGGATSVGGNATYENAIFKNNGADDQGGAVFGADISTSLGNVTLKNCLVVDNYGYKGAMAILGNSFTAVGCTFADNTCGDDSYGIFYTRHNVSFKNSIVLGSFHNEGTLSADYVLSENWATSGTNVKYDSSKPLFVDAANGDYSLAEGSQVVNIGNNAYVTTETDLAGTPRIVDGTVDLGAYEYYDPSRVAAVSVSGTFEIGETLTATVFPRTATVDYAWYKGDVLKGTGASIIVDEAGNDWKVVATGTGDFSGTVEKTFGVNEAKSTTVTILEDVFDPYDGEISLREAISYAKDGDEITFADSLKDSARTINLSNGQFELSKTLTIDATSVDGITIDAQKNSRIFNVTGGTDDAPVTLKGLTLQNGYTPCP